MAIKPNNPQSGVQAQAERPPVFGPLVAGVVLIKAFAAIKGESAVAMPEFDYLLTEESNTQGWRSGSYGLSIPSTDDLATGAGSGLEPMSYTQPFAHQADEARVGGDAWNEENASLDTASNRFQGRTGDSDFRISHSASSELPVPDVPVAVWGPSEQSGAATTGGDAVASSGGTTTGEGTDQDEPTEDIPDGGVPSQVVFNTPPNPGENFLGEGGGADDTLTGGMGDEFMWGLGGDDTLYGRGGDDSLHGGSEDDRLLGGHGDDRLDGGGGDDHLSGGKGDDHLDGGAADDRLFGLDGDDLLIGGLGRDELSGDRGADRFVLNDIAESLTQNPDQLLDFRAYERDKIDVSGIDANSRTVQDEAFSFIANDLFSGSGGELRFTESHGSSYLYGDVNGDGEADFGLELLGVSGLTIDDIIL